MDYVELEIPSGLQGHVQCLWRLRDAQMPTHAQTVYPDGRCELIVHRAAPMRLYTLAHGWQTQSHCLFAAQQRTAIRLMATGPVDCIGVRLLPAASALIAGHRLASLVDDIVDMETLDARFADQLTDACTAFEDAKDPQALWTLIERRIAGEPVDPQIARATAALDACHGQRTITALARDLAMSLRSLQMRFLHSVGLTAKEYARVQRLQATLRHLDDNAESLSQLAASAGFADQAHATREVQRLTGLTPARLRQALHAERDGDAALQMAAAFVRGQGGNRERTKGVSP